MAIPNIDRISKPFKIEGLLVLFFYLIEKVIKGMIIRFVMLS